jgi:hypothetical protein
LSYPFESNARTLPGEVWLKIFSFCSSLQTVGLALPLVCKRWRELAESNEVWKEVAKRHWPEVRTNARVRTWKTFVRRRRKLEPLEGHPVENCSFKWDFGMYFLCFYFNLLTLLLMSF